MQGRSCPHLQNKSMNLEPAHNLKHNRSIKPLARLKHSLFRLQHPRMQVNEEEFNRRAGRRKWANVPKQVNPPREGVV